MVGCKSKECCIIDNSGVGGMNVPCKCLENLNKRDIEFVKGKLLRYRMLEANIRSYINSGGKNGEQPELL